MSDRAITGDLLRDLAGLIGDADPVPDHLVAAAKAAPEMVGLDEAYLHLVAGSAEVAAVRGEPARDLVFRSPDCTLEVSVHVQGDARNLDGQVLPGDAVEVIHERLTDERRAPVDSFGQFLLSRVPAGLGRLVVVTTGGRRLPAAWVVW